MRIRGAFLAGCFVLAAAATTRGQSVGIFADAAGTNCSLSAPAGTPVTWYFLYRPGPSDAPVQSMTVRIQHPGLSELQYLIESVPGPTVVSSVGNPISANPAQLTFACAGSGSDPILLYTLNVTNFGAVTRRDVDPTAQILRCDNSESFVTGHSVLNAVLQPRPAVSPFPQDQAVNVARSISLSWDGIQTSDPCLPYSVVADVYFGVDPNPPFLRRTAGTFTTVSGLAFGTTYYWRVDTVLLPQDLHIPSAVWRFTTESPPPPPQVCPASCTDATECPSSCMQLSGVLFCDPGSKAEHSATRACASPDFSEAHGQMDLAAGSLSCSVDDCHETANGAVVSAFDRFRIVGPPSGSPLAVTARLQCNGDGQACIREGNLFACGGAPTVQLDLLHQVDEEFVLEYRVSASGFMQFSGYMNAQLAFVGLPAGYSVVSCHGFPSTVAVQPTAWGAWKSMYR